MVWCVLCPVLTHCMLPAATGAVPAPASVVGPETASGAGEGSGAPGPWRMSAMRAAVSFSKDSPTTELPIIGTHTPLCWLF